MTYDEHAQARLVAESGAELPADLRALERVRQPGARHRDARAARLDHLRLAGQAAQPCGGFEGNAQSLRVLTRLEVKVERAGLNLTRAALDAATKYPWPRREGTSKFGVYEDDLPVFAWLREGAPGERQSFETQVMDWADDVAYSVHDLEDGIVTGLVDLARLRDPDEQAALAELAAEHYSDASAGDLREVLVDMLQRQEWPAAYDGLPASAAALKNLTSTLIGRFCSAAEDATRAVHGDGRLTRYAADLVVPQRDRAECALLKAVTALSSAHSARVCAGTTRSAA